MNRQMLRLVWNRKRSNALIMIEIFFSFLVVFAVVVASVHVWSAFTKPLGYKYANVWNVSVDTRDTRVERVDEDVKVRMDRLAAEVRTLRGVDSAALTEFVPFEEDVSDRNLGHNGRTHYFQFNRGDEALADTLGIKLVQGRWFDASDGTGDAAPLVIDSDTAEIVFGSTDPIGKRLMLGDNPLANGRVVGVIEDFRRGELSREGGYVFMNVDPTDPDQGLSGNILIRVPQGTTAAFEEALIDRMQAAEPAWSFDVRPLEQLRASNLKFRLLPLILGAVIASFLSMTVALGLVGVLWQNVTQRTREMGLRRAIGASAARVRTQVLGELMVVTSFSLILGTLVVIQIPLTGMAGRVEGGVFLAGLLISLALIYLLAALCALYPSWLATRVQPADALRTE